MSPKTRNNDPITKEFGKLYKSAGFQTQTEAGATLGCEQGTISKFLKGHLTPSKDQIQALRNLQPSSYPPDATYVTWRSELTENLIEFFVGRQDILARIHRFRASCKAQSGYLCIGGTPGAGKSTIMAQIVSELKCPSYFFRVQDRWRSTAHFYQELAGELINRFHIPDSEVPSEVRRLFQLEPGDELMNETPHLLRILQMASPYAKASEDGCVTIVVDALDECDEADRPINGYLLGFPERLPEGICFLMAGRGSAPDRRDLPHDANRDTFNIEEDSANQADVAAYVVKRSQDPAIMNWIKSSGLSLEDCSSILADRSQCNFMYLKYLFQEIRTSPVSDEWTLSSLPKGLMGYYDLQWRRLRLDDTSDQKRAARLQILSLLADHEVPVSIEHFKAVVRISEREILDISQPWCSGGYLKKLSTNGETIFSIFHKSFSEYLKSRETVQATLNELAERQLEEFDKQFLSE